VTSPAAYKQDQDVVRVTAASHSLPFTVETMMIQFENVTGSTCDLVLLWDRTAVTIPIRTDVDTKVMAQIDDVIIKDDKPYYTAAVYYMENGKDLNKSLEWFNKAIEKDPNAFFIYYQKARCEAKLGKKQDAITTAQKSIELAKAAKNDDYVTLNEKLIASLK
jgi:tetratricopeptide (TPR) repeat protein